MYLETEVKAKHTCIADKYAHMLFSTTFFPTNKQTTFPLKISSRVMKSRGF